MPGTIRRTIRHRMSRRRNDQANRPQPNAPIGISSATAALTILTLEFDQPVSLNGVPQFTTDIAGASPVSAALTSPTTVEITFDNDLTGATIVNIPFRDPAIRNLSGGYVSSDTFPV
jgi:hypothetical protein